MFVVSPGCSEPNANLTENNSVRKSRPRISDKALDLRTGCVIFSQPHCLIKLAKEHVALTVVTYYPSVTTEIKPLEIGSSINRPSTQFRPPISCNHNGDGALDHFSLLIFKSGPESMAISRDSRVVSAVNRGCNPHPAAICPEGQRICAGLSQEWLDLALGQSFSIG